MRFLLIIFILLPINPSYAKVLLASGLNAQEREKLVHTLGMNLSTKLLSAPFPLGGFPGYEIGINVEEIDLSSSTLLIQPSKLRYPKFSFAKGLFNDMDLYFDFTPPLRQTTISQYGILLKWSFFQGKFLPIVWSLLVHNNTSNVDDSITSNSTGVEVTAGFSFERASFYAGVGQVKTISKFVGVREGSNFTDTGLAESLSVTHIHSLIGFTYAYSKVFVSAQVDRYKEPVYSTKVGLRF